jgi:hypothetical protein
MPTPPVTIILPEPVPEEVALPLTTIKLVVTVPVLGWKVSLVDVTLAAVIVPDVAVVNVI